MLGYYKQPEATAQKIRDGWVHTGDMGVKDASIFAVPRSSTSRSSAFRILCSAKSSWRS